MDLFIIGDVHGCFYTLKAMLEFWDPKKEILIQLGDLIDRGNFTPQVIKLCREIEKEHPSSVFLKGNHEWLALQYYHKNKEERWYDKYGKKVLWDYVLSERKFEEDAEWMRTLRTHWENEYIMVSHAGISVSPFAMDQDHYSGLLWHRLEIRTMNKVQVFGHTPVKGNKPQYDPKTNSYNIDTGAYLGNSLTGIKLNEKGVLLETHSIPTIEKDIKKGL
jgi:serine/threonine protein phosphatase 1